MREIIVGIFASRIVNASNNLYPVDGDDLIYLLMQLDGQIDGQIDGKIDIPL